MKPLVPLAFDKISREYDCEIQARGSPFRGRASVKVQGFQQAGLPPPFDPKPFGPLSLKERERESMVRPNMQLLLSIRTKSWTRYRNLVKMRDELVCQ